MNLFKTCNKQMKILVIKILISNKSAKNFYKLFQKICDKNSYNKSNNNNLWLVNNKLK